MQQQMNFMESFFLFVWWFMHMHFGYFLSIVCITIHLQIFSLQISSAPVWPECRLVRELQSVWNLVPSFFFVNCTRVWCNVMIVVIPNYWSESYCLVVNCERLALEVILLYYYLFFTIFVFWTILMRWMTRHWTLNIRKVTMLSHTFDV